MVSMLFKLIAIISEGILGIPVVGGSIVLAFVWIPLVIMLFIHILGLIFANMEGKSTTGHILGIITSVLGWIPFLGWILHCVTFIVLLTDIIADSKNNQRNKNQSEIIPNGQYQHNAQNMNSNYPVRQNEKNDTNIIEGVYKEEQKK